MNTRDTSDNALDELSKAKDPDIRASLSALRRAAQQARRIAIQTETYLVIVKNGQLLRISADELRQLAQPNQLPLS